MPTGYAKNTGINPFKGKTRPAFSKVHIERMKKSMKGRVPWNKGKKGLQTMSLETRKKMRLSHLGEKSHLWKGNKVGYHGIHGWVIRQKGKASEYICKCGKQAQHWANTKAHKYKRRIEDFEAMCAKCHRIYDLNNKR